jgi:hypothetical protein
VEPDKELLNKSRKDWMPSGDSEGVRVADQSIEHLRHKELSGRRCAAHQNKGRFCAFAPNKHAIVNQFDQAMPVGSSLLHALTDKRPPLNAVFVGRSTNDVTRGRTVSDFIWIYCLELTLSDQVSGFSTLVRTALSHLKSDAITRHGRTLILEQHFHCRT